jgi:calcium-dependent protein kinase
MDRDSEASKRADVWSVGILLYILICGRPPFEGKTNDLLVDNIRKCEFIFNGREWDSLPDAKNLIYELMRFDPTDRMEASEAANHSFFRNILLNKTIQNNSRAKRDPQIINHLEFFYVSFHPL